MQTKLLTLLFWFSFLFTTAQDQQRVFHLNQKIAIAKNDADKIIAMGDLAEYFAVYKLNSRADSILLKALALAEVSSDKELVLKILFNNNVTNLSAWSSKETFERSINFVQKGLQHAQELNREDYVALAYIRLAGIYRKRSLYDEAIQQATKAFTALGDTKADSLKCALYNELGDIYLAKSDAVPALKNYNNAFANAYKLKNIQLQSEIYHRFSELYRSFGNEEMGKANLLQSLELNTLYKNTEGQFKDYIDLARITNEREYIDKASKLAKTLASDRYELSAKRLLYYWYMVEGKNSSATFKYLNENPDLVDFFKNQGMANYYWQIGDIYHYSSNFDSALYYYKLAEDGINESYGISMKLNISNSFAETYLKNKDSSMAKIYYEKTFFLCRQIDKVASLPLVSNRLGMLYAREGDFKMAYYYALQADSVNQILQNKAAKDKMVLLQVERENKKRESDLMESIQQTERKHNLQIMAILLLISGIFGLMLFLGMFAVSKTTIKMIGFFAFICLFEFIIVLLDHPIIAISHGEPLKIWGIKICLIALLVPLQHYLEHRMIRFLQSRKLLEARQRFSLRNWWYRIKKPAPVKDAGEADEAGVL